MAMQKSTTMAASMTPKKSEKSQETTRYQDLASMYLRVDEQDQTLSESQSAIVQRILSKKRSLPQTEE
jgi:hypothetical protein